MHRKSRRQTVGLSGDRRLLTSPVVLSIVVRVAWLRYRRVRPRYAGHPRWGPFGAPNLAILFLINRATAVPSNMVNAPLKGISCAGLCRSPPVVGKHAIGQSLSQSHPTA